MAKPAKGDWKPLMDAAFAGDAATVARLLAAGADPDVASRTRHRHRPLHRAIEHKKTIPKHGGHEEVVRLLLDHGADPRLRGGFEDMTALQLAATGEPRFLPLLVPRLTPLDVFAAAATLDDDRVALLVAADPGLAVAVDDKGWTALHHAAASAVFRTGPPALDAQLRIARTLLAAGADPNARYRFEDGSGIPVLYECCGRHDNPGLARLLLAAGADPCDGESLFHAAENEHRGCLALFAETVDADRLAAEATRTLRVLVTWRRVRGAAWLLAHGADPDALDPRTGDGALHGAIRHRAGARLVAMLLDHGARPDAPNRDGDTALDLAHAAGDGDVARLLERGPRR